MFNRIAQGSAQILDQHAHAALGFGREVLLHPCFTQDITHIPVDDFRAGLPTRTLFMDAGQDGSLKVKILIGKRLGEG